ncbi:MAG TPA: hypothetical protein VFC18_15050 [Burkholderiales bacterium]|nr:hypothetical protein [Burkholderiales bacterium]
MRDERPVGAVPRWVLLLLGAAFAAHVALQAGRPSAAPIAHSLPPAPSAEALSLAAFGERALLARVTMLYLQAFELAELDYERLIAWLSAILELDPRSDYPLFAAARVYAEVADPARSRAALEFVYERFLADPDRRWPWLAHAALLAKHRLKDLPLARRYAQAIDRHTRSPGVPLWAKQMEVFILEDMGELEAAKVMLGGLLEGGYINDPAEAAFLKQRLDALGTRR